MCANARLESCDPHRRTPGSKFAGGHRIRVTPVPIPNTEVKPDTADGTAWETVWESRSLPALFYDQARREQSRRAFSLYATAIAPARRTPDAQTPSPRETERAPPRPAHRASPPPAPARHPPPQ